MNFPKRSQRATAQRVVRRAKDPIGRRLEDLFASMPPPTYSGATGDAGVDVELSFVSDPETGDETITGRLRKR